MRAWVVRTIERKEIPHRELTGGGRVRCLSLPICFVLRWLNELIKNKMYFLDVPSAPFFVGTGSPFPVFVLFSFSYLFSSAFLSFGQSFHASGK
jgi:hypothetical protein